MPCKDPERRKAILARYAAKPEVKARVREWTRNRVASDPEMQERVRERARAYAARVDRSAKYAEYRSDPEVAARLKVRAAEIRSANQSATSSSATRHRRPWSPAEDAIAADLSLTAVEVAFLTGRTYFAARGRRELLSKKEKP